MTGALCLTCAACSLDEEIFDNPTADSFIENEQDVSFQLTGIYGLFSTFNCYKFSFNNIITYGGDDAALISTRYSPFTNRTISSSDRSFATPWAVFYQVINNTNSLMEKVEKSGVLSEAYKSRILGELHFLRGFSYFNLVRIYGGVPVRTSSTNQDSDFYPSRNPAGEVYELILQDLARAAASCLPFSQQPAGEFGRATKAAAQGMLAKAWLTYGNMQDLANDAAEAREAYQHAKDYADSVILSGEYELIPDYAGLWDVKQEGAAYREVIFGIQYTRDPTAASASSIGSEYAYFYQPATRDNVSGNITDGQGVGILRIQPWFYDLYRSGEYENDYRTEVSFLTSWTNNVTGDSYITYPEAPAESGDTGIEPFPYLNKYRDPDGLQARNNENDLFILRLAEVYLIKAEAENELNGPTPVAYGAFNKLRQRARNAGGNSRSTPPDLLPGLSKEEFRMKIFDERGLELVGEGHRWFDAVRMRYKDNARTMIQYRYEEFYPQMVMEEPVYNTSGRTWEGGRVQPLNVAPFSDKFLLWPVPGTEIDANPNTSQNPGW